ncbi:uncharacterized protein KGF55_000952 [Candida pseudojiufengensis]|uniref:uncharacterized protein n=1 Tax=Candida pseudojiufengensis TaxID=497109 RepID=UPI0022254CCE|nr:uncharacterized protein KGF55_000952 [Candida pseudojiufengensis]KAI5965590.1 hypothetical protein KGF55_000952 [Candida pseudojiufengensis]
MPSTSHLSNMETTTSSIDNNTISNNKPISLSKLPTIETTNLSNPSNNNNNQSNINFSSPRTSLSHSYPSHSHPNSHLYNNHQFLSPKSSRPSTSSLSTLNSSSSSSTSSSPINNNNTGSISGNHNFAINSPSPTTPTFATSFPSSIQEQRINDFNPCDFDFIFDVRPYNSYCKSRITKSVNLCLPTTLLKRNSLCLNDLINMVDLSTELKDTIINHIKNENEPEKKLNILLYDQCSTNEAITFPLYQTISKFEKLNNKFEIYYLNGGFSNVLTQKPEFIENTSINLNSNGHRKTKSLSGFTLPSASNFKTKFVQSIKKNNDYDGDKSKKESEQLQTSKTESPISYKYKLQDIPKDLKLPEWLKFFKELSNEEIIKELINKFNKIEDIEKNRLNKMASNFKSPSQPNIQGQEKIFSPCCISCSSIDFQLPKGIEFGYKNRYNNVWPYEHSRVKLEHHQHQHNTNNQQHRNSRDDYFNGNYINVNSLVKNDFTYIATQNPLASTIDDFWTTVIQEDIKIIINLDSKPIEYFNHSSINSIETIKTNFPDFKLRLINKNIYHFHYLSWPDFGVPKSFKSIIDLIEFKNEIKSIKQNNISNKILVHCNAGCGRTGVFITIDSLIQSYKNSPEQLMNSKIDLIYKLVQHQRRQRISMVQNLDQFIVCYEIFINYYKERKEQEAKQRESQHLPSQQSHQIPQLINEVSTPATNNLNNEQELKLANIWEIINNVENFSTYLTPNKTQNQINGFFDNPGDVSTLDKPSNNNKEKNFKLNLNLGNLDGNSVNGGILSNGINSGIGGVSECVNGETNGGNSSNGNGGGDYFQFQNSMPVSSR